jgi:hypothetical protein
MGVSGTYDCVTKTPMGDQKSKFTVNADGDTFTGQQAGAMGSMDVVDGKVDGNKLTWKMNMTVPMPMTLTAEATVDGDTLTGTVDAGALQDADDGHAGRLKAFLPIDLRWGGGPLAASEWWRGRRRQTPLARRHPSVNRLERRLPPPHRKPMGRIYRPTSSSPRSAPSS